MTTIPHRILYHLFGELPSKLGFVTFQDSTAAQETYPTFKSSIERLLHNLSYDKPITPIALNNSDLKTAMLDEIAKWGVDDGRNGKFCEGITEWAAALATWCYSNLVFDSRVVFALCIWCLLYIDDLSKEMPTAIAEYQRRILVGEPQLDPVLEQFPRVMGKLYLYWDPPCANAMSSSALDFVTGTLMEDKAEVQQMRLHPEARNWPKFLRTKTGISAMFAHSIFPKTAYPDLAIYAQALPDIEDFLSFVNDLFSYYKEELAGEDTNYVATRAKVSANPPLRVVSDLVDEVTRYHEDILAMLSDHPQAVRRWREFVQSYLGFHLSVTRYRLSELGF